MFFFFYGLIWSFQTFIIQIFLIIFPFEMIPWITLWLIWLNSAIFFYVNNTKSDLHIHLSVLFIKFCSLMTIHFHPSFTFLFNFPLDFHQCLKVCFFFSFFCFEKFHFILFSISISLFFFFSFSVTSQFYPLHNLDDYYSLHIS